MGDSGQGSVVKHLEVSHSVMRASGYVRCPCRAHIGDGLLVALPPEAQHRR